MKVLYVTLFLVFNYARSSGSSILPSPSNPIADENKFFPNVEYPQSVLETSRAFFKPIGVLEPFSEDVKSSFKSIVETSKKPKQEPTTSSIFTETFVGTKGEPQNTNVSSNEIKEAVITGLRDDIIAEIDNEESNINELNDTSAISLQENAQDKATNVLIENVNNTDTETGDFIETTVMLNHNDTEIIESYYTVSNITTGNENSTIEEYRSQENIMNETEKLSSETEKVSSDADDTANTENETTAEDIKSESTPLELHGDITVQESEPVEGVLPRPPLTDYDDNIAVVETEDEDSILSPISEEMCN